METPNNQIVVGSVVVHTKRPVNNPPKFIVKTIDGNRCTMQMFHDIERTYLTGKDSTGTYDIEDLVFVEQRDVYEFKIMAWKNSAYIRLDKPEVYEYKTREEAEPHFDKLESTNSYWLIELIVTSAYKNHKAFSCRKYLKK